MKPKPQQLHSSAVDTIQSCKALLDFLCMHGFRCQSWQGVGSSAFYFGPSHSSPTKLGYCIENVTTWGLPLLGKKLESLALAGVPALISDRLNCTIDLAS